MNSQAPLECVVSFGQDDNEVDLITDAEATRVSYL
jgi:hypothetical protein